MLNPNKNTLLSIHLTAATLVLICISGCASMPFYSQNMALQQHSADIKNVSFDKTFPAPDTAIFENAYRINTYDLIEINVYKEDDLTRILRVSADGYISFPLIGKVKIAGYTTIEAGDKLAEILEKDYLRNPSVTVLVKEYNIKKVMVLGEVKNPGSYPIPSDGRMTVMEAVAAAGGFTPNAKKDNTKVIRMDGNQKFYINVKVSEITERGNKLEDIPLKANDIIYIGERIF